MHRSRPCAGGSCKRAARPPAGLLRLKQQEAQAEVKRALQAAQQPAQESGAAAKEVLSELPAKAKAKAKASLWETKLASLAQETTTAAAAVKKPEAKAPPAQSAAAAAVALSRSRFAAAAAAAAATAAARPAGIPLARQLPKATRDCATAAAAAAQEWGPREIAAALKAGTRWGAAEDAQLMRLAALRVPGTPWAHTARKLGTNRTASACASPALFGVLRPRPRFKKQLSFLADPGIPGTLRVWCRHVCSRR